MNTIILIHGIGGLDRETYFPHLKLTCEGFGLNVIMPSFGGYKDGATYEKWKQCFDQNYKQFLSKHTIVICQSMGTQFIVKYLAEQRKEVGFYVSCAGPYNATMFRGDAGEHVNKFKDSAFTFVPNKEEYAIFNKLNFTKHSFFSDNDCFYDQNNLEKYSKSIGSAPTLLHDKSHFQMEYFEELEIFIKDIITR